jgi:hypothetical protein
MAQKITTAKLARGLTLGAVTYDEADIREGTLADAFAAEDIASVNQELKFDAALLVQRIVLLRNKATGETFAGVLTLDILGRLKTADFNALRRGMAEAEEVGEPEPAPGPTG